MRGVAHPTARSLVRSLAGLVILSMAACSADSSGDSGSMAGSSAEEQPDPLAIRPFTIDISDEVLTDLKDRLSRTRLPEESPGTGWDQGANRAYVMELLAYWEDEFDWRAQERRLNEFDHFKTVIDGLLSQ